MNNCFDKDYEFLPWIDLTDDEKAEQKEWQKKLEDNYPVKFGEESVVSRKAYLHHVRGSFGKGTLVGAHALFRCLDISAGDFCSFNTYCVVHGKVDMGNCVRIAPGAKIFGENHGFSALDMPICAQPNTRKGIKIGSDVWIGANAVICDGAVIGDGCVIGAGAVVTKNIPPYSVAAGNPAKVIKSRLAQKKNDEEFVLMIKDFAKWIGENYREIISAHFEEGRYVNSARDKEERRAVCDAVEIGAFFDDLPKDLDKGQLINTIRTFQKDENEYESVLSASYALEILGEKPVEFTFVNCDVWQHLDRLKWNTDPWDAGHYTDIFATAWYFNRKYYGYAPPTELFLYLDGRQCMDGLWGKGDMRLRVNGYYRLTRGSYDQFGRAPVRVKEAVDTILDYAEKKGAPDNACDALDIIHPLYFAAKYTGYKKSLGEAWCAEVLPKFISMATDKGFPFKKGEEASLKGTEMWMSIIFLICDYLGYSSLLGYTPKGVHRIN